MPYPIKYIENNLVWNNEGECLSLIHILYRRYKLFSDVQRADDIEVVIDGAAGQKQFAYMESVKLKNPSVTAEGYVINGRAFVDYILHAEDIEKA